MAFSTPISIDLLGAKDISKKFREWQSQRSGLGETGMITSTVEFARFCRCEGAFHPEDLFDEFGRPKAPGCGHIIHPSQAEDDVLSYCPVCDVLNHLNLLKLITTAWNLAGGPWEKGFSRPHMLAWHEARLELENFLELLQEDADEETRWEKEHPAEAEAAKKTLSAARAIKFARRASKYPGKISANQPREARGLQGPLVLVSNVENNHVSSKSGLITPPITPEQVDPRNTVATEGMFTPLISVPKSKNNKKVTWPSTKNFAPSRSSHWYKRESKSYRPGTYAAREGRELLNTSNMYKAQYNARQLKVVMNPDPRVAERLVKGIAVEEHEGIARLHPRWLEIRRIIAKKTSPKVSRHDQVLGILNSAEFLAVRTIPDGSVKDVVPYMTLDVEDLSDKEDSEGSVVASKGEGWTSHSEILPTNHSTGLTAAWGRDGSERGDLRFVGELGPLVVGTPPCLNMSVKHKHEMISDPTM